MPPTKVLLMEVGSFNPPTNMHLRLFEIARDYLDQTGHFKVIGGLVSPVHDLYDKKDLLPATHRCAMLRLALNSSDWIYLSDWECKQEKWTRTQQVIQYHQNMLNSISCYQESPNKKMCYEEQTWIKEVKKHCNNDDKILVKLVCGGDLLESFAVPGLWRDDDIEAIINDHGLVVISRSGSNPQKFIYESDVLTKYQKNICIVTEWITNEISSTKIRRALRRGQSVKYLISDSVIEYIQNNALFGVVDNKYNLSILNGQQRAKNFFMTPSPSDDPMMSPSPSETRIFIDVPDNSGNFNGGNSCMSLKQMTNLFGNCKNSKLPELV